MGIVVAGRKEGLKSNVSGFFKDFLVKEETRGAYNKFPDFFRMGI